jgi:hypothetical protein
VPTPAPTRAGATIPTHLTTADRLHLRRRSVARGLRTIVQAQQHVNQQRIVTRIIVQGQADTPITLLIDLSAGPRLRLRQTLDLHGHLEIDVPLPSNVRPVPTVRRVRVIVGTGTAALTYSPSVH